MIGGIRLEGKKESTALDWTIRRPKRPDKVFIPLPHGAVPVVDIRQCVCLGEKIAEPQDPRAAALHSSISGKVTKIGRFPHPVFGEAEAIEISAEGPERAAPEIGKERNGWQGLSRANLLEIFRDNGLAELDLEMETLCAKISRQGEPEVLVINGSESEPYVTCDYALMMSHPVEVLKGAEILRKAVGAERIVFSAADNPLETAELLKSKIYFLKWKHAEVRIFPSRHPQGSEFALKREMAGGSLFELFAGKGQKIAVHNVATAYEVYEAVVYQKPFYERVTTVAGECVMEPRNFWLRIGTPFAAAIQLCRGLLREPRKLLMGGPMKGLAQLTQNVPVLSGTQAILALPKEVARQEQEGPCIRCGRCTEACPVEISPAFITLAAERKLFHLAADYGARFCIECGNCGYVCPSKRPMVELIRLVRSAL